MFNEELLEFIRAQRAAGMNNAEIERMLMAEGGWDKSDIDEATRALSTPSVTPPPPAPTPAPVIKITPPPATPPPIVVSAPAPSFPVTASPVVASQATASPLATKKEGWSLQSLLTEKQSSTPAVSKEASQPAPTAPAIPPPSPAPITPPTQPSPMKFNLSALHLGDTPPATTSSGTPPAAPAPQAGVKVDVSPPPLSGAPAAEKAKTAISGKRTMISDLLQHKGGSTSEATPIQAGASAGQSVATTPGSSTDETKKEQVSGSSSAPTPSPFDDDLAHRNKVKRLLEISIGVLFLLVSIGGGIYAFTKLHTPDQRVMFETALSNFYSVPAFTYKGQVTTNLVLTGLDTVAAKNGMIKFSLRSGGSLTTHADGYGDGNHEITFTGGWQVPGSSTTTFTDIISDIRLIGNSLYYHTTSLPAATNLDPELFRANWIKVDFSELMALLQVSGIAPGTEEYGNFGGTSAESAFTALLKKTTPLRVSGEGVSDTLEGVAAMRIPVIADPAAMTDFARALFRKYANHDLVLSPDEAVRFTGAMAKITGDVWVNTQTGKLEKISLAANFADDIFGVHVEGPVAFDVALADVSNPISVEVPAGVLTLTELNVKIAEYEETKKMRARDQVRVDDVALLASVLESYRSEKGRYPKDLTDLYSSGKLETSTLDATVLKEYFYRSYQKVGVYTAKGQCLSTGKVCAFYHLGVNLEDVMHGALKEDVDQKTAILGADSAGCGGEVNRACYDVVAPGTSTPPPISATTPPAAP